MVKTGPVCLVPDDVDLSGGAAGGGGGGEEEVVVRALGGRQGPLPPCSPGITSSSIPSLATRPSVAMASDVSTELWPLRMVWNLNFIT